MIHIKPLRSSLIHFVSPDDLFGESECVTSIVNTFTGKDNELVWSPITFEAYVGMATLMSIRHCYDSWF